MRLEYPLNDAIPNITNARDRLLTKIFQYRKNELARQAIISANPSQNNSQVNLHEHRDLAETESVESVPSNGRGAKREELISYDLGGDGTRGLRGNVDGEIMTTDEDYALLYAYALVTGQLGLEIELLGKEIEGLFGVLDEDLLQLR